MQPIQHIIIFAIPEPEISDIGGAAFGISLHFRFQFALIIHITPIYVASQLIIYTIFSGISKFIVTITP